MNKRLTLYKFASYFNLGLFLASLIMWILFGCLSQIATPKNMTFAALFYVFFFISGYSFASWLFSKKAINAIENKNEYKNIHIINTCLGLFCTFYPALLSLKEFDDENKKEKAHFKVPMIEFEVIAISLAVGLFLIDLITKLTVVNYFATHDEPITVIDGFLRINYTINIAAAFGFGVGNAVTNRIVYCVVASIILFAIIGGYIWKRKKIAPTFKICILVIAAGALGNLIDRIFYSPEFLHSPENGVVDWIDFYKIWSFNFNIADCCVVLGAIALIIYLIVDEVKTSKANRKPQVAGKVLSVEEQRRLDAVKGEQVVKSEENKLENTDNK